MGPLFPRFPDLLFSNEQGRYWPRRAALLLGFVVYPLALAFAFVGPWFLHQTTQDKRHLSHEAALERVRLAMAGEQHYYSRAVAALTAADSDSGFDVDQFSAIGRSLLTNPSIIDVAWVPADGSGSVIALGVDSASAHRAPSMDTTTGVLASPFFSIDTGRVAFSIQTPASAHGYAQIVVDSEKWLGYLRAIAAVRDAKVALFDGRLETPEPLSGRDGARRGATMFMGRAYTISLLPDDSPGGFLDSPYLVLVGLLVGVFTVMAAAGLVMLHAHHGLLLRYEHVQRESAQKDARHREDLAAMRVQVARQRHQDMSSMARSIAHDIRNRLMQASSVAQTLKIMVEAKIVPDRPPYSHFQNLDKEISSINTLLNALISLGGDEDRTIEVGPYPAGNVVTTAWRLNKDVSYTNKVDFQLIAQRAFIIRVDYASALKALKAVLLNSIEACAVSPGGARKVEVSIFQTLGIESQQAIFDFSDSSRDHNRMWVCIQITDNGVGIAAGEVEKVFWPTYSTKAGARGHGLPSVVREIERHKGAITLSSTPNTGTTVRLYFEEAPPEMRPVATAAAIDNQPVPFTLERSLQIKGVALVVDDEANVRSVLCDYLTAQGLQVVDASTGEEALEMIRTGAVKPDIVVLDHRLGIGVGGLEVAEAIRGKGPWKIIHVSATTNENLKLPDDEAFLQKPFGPVKIQAALRRVLKLPTD